MMTGNGATTLTPENSEAPRESRGDIGLLERFDATAALQMGEESRGAKVSSPELASLAAKYVNMTDGEYWAAMALPSRQHELAVDMRSLAASVLAQAEGNPRK